jgi:hypothetical protein
VERTRQEAEGTYVTPVCYTLPDEEINKDLWEAPPVKDFDPPYLRGGAFTSMGTRWVWVWVSLSARCWCHAAGPLSLGMIPLLCG